MMSVTSAPRGMVDLVRDVLDRYGRLGGSQLAAAIAYRALFSVVPLATFAATILAELYREDGLNRPETGNVLISIPTFATANPVGSVDAHFRSTSPP
jgi:uncharacterized BrkB/YihY/UPF0761 family membrane protein